MCFIDCLIIHKRNVDYLLRLRSRGIAKHLVILNQQMPTPFGVNYLLSFLITFYLFGEFLEQESKSGCSSYMSFTKYLSLSHRHEGLMFDNMVVCFRLQRQRLFMIRTRNPSCFLWMCDNCDKGQRFFPSYSAKTSRSNNLPSFM